MTGLLEDRLRRSLSAVADATSIPAVPAPGSAAVVHPLRRRVVFGTAGVGIAAAVTALAVVVSGGTDLAGPRAGTPKAPAPLSELQASAAANCAHGQASLKAEQHKNNPTLPAGQGFSYNAPDVDPRLAPDLLYVAPTSAGAPLANLDVNRICDPNFVVATPPLRAVVRLGPDERTIVAAASVTRDPAGEVVPVNVTDVGKISDASMHGVVGHVATANPPGSGLRDVWWAGADGRLWLVQTSGLSQSAAIAFAKDLRIDGTTAVVPGSGWRDVTPATQAPLVPEYELDSDYGLGTKPTYYVSAGHGAMNFEVYDAASVPGGSMELTTVRGAPALITRLPGDDVAQVVWDPTPGVSVSVQGPVSASGSAGSVIAFADSLRLVAPGDPALVPVPTSSSSAAVATPPASPSDFAPGTHSVSATASTGGWLRMGSPTP